MIREALLSMGLVLVVVAGVLTRIAWDIKAVADDEAKHNHTCRKAG